MSIEVRKMQSSYVEHLLSAWHENQVEYCHWKSIDHLKESLDGRTDLDILVSRSCAVEAERWILSCGFVPMITAAPRSYPGVNDYVAYDSELDRFIHLHLHYQLVLGDRWVKAYRLPVEQGVLQRRVWLEAQQTWVVSPTDELVMYCARMCVKFARPFVRSRVQQELHFFCDRVGVDVFDAEVRLSYGASLMKLAELAVVGDLSALDTHSRVVRRDMCAYLRMSRTLFFIRTCLRFSYRLAVELARRKLRIYSFGRRRLARGGLTVAFVGMDGAGKTSAIARNSAFLARQVDVNTFFLGSGRSGAPWYRRIVFSLFGTKAKLKHKTAKARTDSAHKHYSLHYLVWNWICSRDRIKRLHQVHQARSAGTLVLVDRWPQDVVPNSFDGPKLAQVADTLFAAQARAVEQESCRWGREFAPDLVLRFVVSPVVARDRKPGELTNEQAEMAKQNLYKISWLAVTRVVDIEADQPTSFVDVAVRQAIWQHLGEDR